MSRSLRSCALFFDHVLPAVEEARALPNPLLSRDEQIRHIQIFFSEIGCTVTPPRLLPNVEFPNVEAFIAAFIERMSVNEDFFSEYFNLIKSKLSPFGPEDVKYIKKNIKGPDRQESFIKEGISGSNYIEDLLYDLLNTTDQYDGINVCVNLLMCPLKVYFKLFIDFTRNIRSITPQNAIKYFNIFMDKSQLIIMKKLELIDFSKMQTADFQFDDDIINVLTSRYIMCLEFFKSALRTGFTITKDLHDTIVKNHDLSHDLVENVLTALGKLKGNIRKSMITLQVQEQSDKVAFLQKRLEDVDRMVTGLAKLTSLTDESINLYDEIYEIAEAPEVQDTGRQQRQQEQRRQPSSQHDNVGGRKRQKKCKNTKKCKNKKKSSRNKKKLSRNKKKS